MDSRLWPTAALWLGGWWLEAGLVAGGGWLVVGGRWLVVDG